MLSLSLSNVLTVTRVIRVKKKKIFNVILDINKYVEFLPYCKESRIVINKHIKNFDCKIRFGNTIIDHNTYSKIFIEDNNISSKLITSSLFDKFDCKWTIKESNSENILNFTVDYTLKHNYYVYGYLLNENIINMYLDLFEKRFYSI